MSVGNGSQFEVACRYCSDDFGTRARTRACSRASGILHKVLRQCTRRRQGTTPPRQTKRSSFVVSSSARSHSTTHERSALRKIIVGRRNWMFYSIHCTNPVSPPVASTWRGCVTWDSRSAAHRLLSRRGRRLRHSDGSQFALELGGVEARAAGRPASREDRARGSARGQ